MSNYPLYLDKFPVIKAKLKIKAKREKRSMHGQILHELEQAVKNIKLEKK